jgi:amidase
MSALVGVARSIPAAAAGSDIEEITVARIQAAMASGELSARSLVEKYLERIEAIDRNGPHLNSVIETNPDAEAIARQLDAERRAGHVRGPLHGVPVLLKDNIDTHDRMQTTAGSLALVGRPASSDATVAAKLRAAGAVIMGKTNLSEWANFRSLHSSSGWCGRGHQCNNPYAIDRNPCGSSSGSGAAPSANLTAVSIGTETDGSIVCPANANGVVGLKPTVGLVSRAGVIPISHSQDTIGPHTRTVADAAAVLDAIASRTPDSRDAATNHGRTLPASYSSFVTANGLRGKRIAVAREGVTGYSEEVDAAYEDAIAAIRAAGATVFDPADIPTIGEINSSLDEFIVLVFEFKDDLNKYLATRSGIALDREGFARTLGGLIAYNDRHADTELKFFEQEIFHFAEDRNLFGIDLTEALYLEALANDIRRGGADGIDALLRSMTPRLDAIVAPTGAPAWTTDLINGDHFLGASSSAAAIAGYPIINVPMGNVFGLPMGISFMGTAFSEGTLIACAAGFEAQAKARRVPKLLATLPLEGGAPRRRRRKDDGREESKPRMRSL